MFKVLSIDKALSIQAHPNKQLGKVLHAKLPSEYKDDNHKPELACAVTDFEALCGFESLDVIYHHVIRVPELHALIAEDGNGESLLNDIKKHLSDKSTGDASTLLKQLFTVLMTSDPSKVSIRVDTFSKRMSGIKEPDGDKILPVDLLGYRLSQQFPQDIGVFCAYFLCYRRLVPGEALFLAANEPHAYLSGDCVEIMACSDNVVRAGLTPKFRDVDTLCSMLTYTMPGHPYHPGKVLSPLKIDAHTVRYLPFDAAVDEFELERVEVKDGDGEYTFKSGTFGGIVLILQGKGTAVTGDAHQSLTKGQVFFVKPNESISVSAKGSEQPLIIFQATKRGSLADPFASESKKVKE